MKRVPKYKVGDMLLTPENIVLEVSRVVVTTSKDGTFITYYDNNVFFVGESEVQGKVSVKRPRKKRSTEVVAQ